MAIENVEDFIARATAAMDPNNGSNDEEHDLLYEIVEELGAWRDTSAPTLAQILAAADLMRRYHASTMRVSAQVGHMGLPDGYVSLELHRDGEHLLDGGIDPNGRVST